MARKPRIEFEGAFYHVIARGNQRQKIFKNPEDYQTYLEILANYKQRYKFFLYAYVLMNNHVHLLVETQDVPLSKIFQGINQSYTQYFNKKYKTVGHLFQGRYKAILCNRDEYLLSLIKYIHLNPVRAKMRKSADEYRWSGHHSYVNKNVNDGVVDTDTVLRMFSENKSAARKLYRSYMDEGAALNKEDVYALIDQRVLGNENFAEKVMGNTATEIKAPGRKGISLNDIARGIEKALGVTSKQIQGKDKSHQISLARKLFSVAANRAGHKSRDIASHIKKDPAAVTRHLRNGDGLRPEVDALIESL